MLKLEILPTRSHRFTSLKPSTVTLNRISYCGSIHPQEQSLYNLIFSALVTLSNVQIIRQPQEVLSNYKTFVRKSRRTQSG